MAISINGTSGISGVDGSAATPAIQGTDTNTGISFGTDEVNINTGGNTAVTVDSSQRVGIGTTSPGHPLDVVADNSTVALNVRGRSSDNIGSVYFRSNDTASTYGYIQGRSNEFRIATDSSSQPIVFHTNTERMRIAGDGGASFFATAAAHGFRSTQNASTDTTLFVATGATSTTNGTVVTRIRSDGDLENSNNSYGPLASDERLKQDIVDIGSQWDDIKNIRLTKFRFKNNPTGDLQLGPIAQELEQVCPGLITRRPAFENEIADPSNDLVDGDEVLSFKASILYMKAVGALQEAMERIEQLETRLAALEGGTN